MYTMNIQYAQASYQEVEASKRLANAASTIEHIIVSLPFYKDIQSRYHPIQSNDISTAYVPARNIVFYGIAAAYAETLSVEAIVFGSNADDSKELPDATPDFILRIREIIKIGIRGEPIEIVNPLIGLNKADVLRLALQLKVPLELTWSCYEDVETPCQRCRGCRTRKEAFTQLGVPDPRK
jgi:7-cyano-7-deazaguanine synthase